MFELGLVKTIIELIKECISLIDRGKENRREVFDRTCKPIFEQMQPVAKAYYQAISRVAFDLTADNVTEIRRALEESRSEIIIEREGISGATRAFARAFGASKQADNTFNVLRDGSKEGSEETTRSLTWEFFSRINTFFYHGYLSFEDDGAFSRATGIIAYLRILEDEIGRKKRNEPTHPGYDEPEGVRYYAHLHMKYMEDAWLAFSESYTRLRFHCEN